MQATLCSCHQRVHYPGLSYTSCRPTLHVLRKRHYVSGTAGEPHPLQPLAGDNPLTEIEQQGEHCLQYRTLQTIIGGIALAEVLEPSQLFELIFGVCIQPTFSGLIRVLGACHLLVAITSHCLSEAADADTLSSPIALRLNLGLLAWSVCSLVAMLSGPVLPSTPAASVLYAALCLATACISGSTYLTYSGVPLKQQGATLSKSCLKMLPNLVEYSSVNAAVYGSATKITAAGSILFWTASLALIKKSILTISVGPLGLTTLRQFAACSLLASFVLYSVKHASKTQTLANPIPRALNLGIAVVCWTSLSLFASWWKAGVLAAQVAGPRDVVTLLTGTKLLAVIVLGAVSLYNYFKAPVGGSASAGVRM